MNDGLTERDRAGIQALLRAYPKIDRDLLFGSRALGTFRPASDVDLTLEGQGLGLRDLLALQAQIAELSLAVEVDLVIRATIINPELEKQIQTHGIEWYRRPFAQNQKEERHRG